VNPRFIILHHSATKDSGTVSWNAIRRYHINECKWGDIGYHFGIEFVEDKGDPLGSYEIIVGRTLDKLGAHTVGRNSDSVGICFVGNFDLEPPPQGQWDAGLKLVRWLQTLYHIPKPLVYGHRDFAVKTCPGTKFDIQKFREDL
jgi:N-acetylmuramoyl-L-alanine amidase